MRKTTNAAVILALCFSALRAQTPTSGEAARVFHLTQKESARDIQEIATTLRAVAGLRKITSDDLARTVSVTGTDPQMAMTEWMIHTLDVAAQPSQPQQYLVPGTTTDVIRIYFTHVASPQSLQEIVTTLRSVVDLQRIFTYNSLRAAVLRGTPAQIGFADWLVGKLDQPGQNQTPREYPYPGLRGPEVARVFYLRHSESPQDMGAMAVTIRSIADLQRIFVYNAAKAITVRGPADRVDLAQWIVGELDRPADQPVAPGDHRYELPTGADNQVRIFYLPAAATTKERQQIAVDVRSSAHVQRLFIYDRLSALTVRGTVGQIATAERLIDERKPPGR